MTEITEPAPSPDNSASALPVESASPKKRPWYDSKRGKKKEEGNVLARWFYGIVKEFRRIQWMRGKDILENLFVVIIIVLLLVAIFSAVDAIFLNGRILGE